MTTETKLTGRELDAAVHRDVMQIVWDKSRCRACGWPLGSFEDGGCTLESCSQRPCPTIIADAPPRYSESIEAAIQVIKKMRAGGWSFACTLYEGKLPYASFCKGTAASSRNAEAETLPEAICLAALKAIELQ